MASLSPNLRFVIDLGTLRRLSIIQHKVRLVDRVKSFTSASRFLVGFVPNYWIRIGFESAPSTGALALPTLPAVTSCTKHPSIVALPLLSTDIAVR
jgi:hypothetical protein